MIAQATFIHSGGQATTKADSGRCIPMARFYLPRLYDSRMARRLHGSTHEKSLRRFPGQIKNIFQVRAGSIRAHIAVLSEVPSSFVVVVVMFLSINSTQIETAIAYSVQFLGFVKRRWNLAQPKLCAEPRSGLANGL